MITGNLILFLKGQRYDIVALFIEGTSNISFTFTVH